MPIRSASLKHKIQNNGARLHLAAASRAHSHPADQAPSQLELALLDERRLLKEARAKRQAEALLPKPKAVKLVKEPKAPKTAKAAKEPKADKAAKAAKGQKPSRAEKVVKKAESLEAAKKATKKSAKT